ncbi:hypothetical protein [Microtetraspora sp. NBRC 13810]|uniref:hypothetical protein n=1 Tax=Microtetraspora sp. NBRC 13810 TaxID=3030990 RepID=UPI0025542A1C|nr:hypothetical protein [Microtetraspora sp. NBRC 13810]
MAEAKLDEAARFLEAPLDAGDPLRFHTADFAEMQRTTCHLDPGTPTHAVAILQNKVAAPPVTHHRDRALYMTRLGLAHAAVNAMVGVRKRRS